MSDNKESGKAPESTEDDKGTHCGSCLKRLPMIGNLHELGTIEHPEPTGDNPYRGMKWTDLQKAARQVKAADAIEVELPQLKMLRATAMECSKLFPEEWEVRSSIPYGDGVTIFCGRHSDNKTIIQWKFKHFGMAERANYFLATQPKNVIALIETIDEYADDLQKAERQLKAEIAAHQTDNANHTKWVALQAVKLFELGLRSGYENGSWRNERAEKAEKERDAEIAANALLESGNDRLMLLSANLKFKKEKAEKERGAALEEMRQLELSLPGTSSLYVPKAAYLAIESERDQLKAELDAALEEVKKYQAHHNTYVYGVMAHEEYRRQTEETLGAYRSDAARFEKEMDQLKAELEELRKQHEKDEIAMQHELREIGVVWDRSDEPINAESGRLAAANGEYKLINSELMAELSELRKQK